MRPPVGVGSRSRWAALAAGLVVLMCGRGTARGQAAVSQPMPGVALAPAAAAVLAAAPAAPPRVDAQGAVTLTLDSAIALALRVATPVQQGRYAAANAGTEVTRSYGGLLPTIGGSAGRTVTTGNPLVGARAMAPWDTRFETMGYQLSTSLNLLGGLAAYPGIRAAQYTKEAYGLTLARTQQSVALDVSQAYLQAVLDSQLVTLAGQNVHVSRQRVDQLSELVRLGKRAPADLYRAQAQRSADESIVYDAEDRLRSDQIALLQRVHIDPQATVVLVAPSLDTTLLGAAYRDTAALVSQALRQRPDLRSAQSEIDATRWGIRRASNENLPSLAIGFGVFSTGRVFDRATQNGVNQVTLAQPSLADQVGDQATTVFSVGVGYNLFDLFRSRLDRQEAQVAYGSAQLVAGDVRRAVAGDVSRAVGEYGVAVDRLGSTAVGLSAAQSAFDLVSGRFEVGFSSIVDLLTAQAALFQAQSLRAQAVIELGLAKRALAYAIGLQPTDQLP
jgi:outer membrane protein